MSEIKPVYQGSRNPSLGWKDISKEEFDEVSKSISKGFTGLFVQVIYPAAAHEALQKELGYSKMAADAEAKFADEYKDKFEAQKQRAYALALVINDLTRMVTYKGETKDEFIKRVKGILSVDPDLRVCELIEANAAQAKRIEELEKPPKPKMAPVQGYAQGIPWDMHLDAYNAYCKKYGRQDALIDLEGRGCRGGFGVGELDMFIPGWREKLSLVGKLNAEIESLRKQLEELKNAATFASSALAHASNNDPLYNKAYLGLRAAIYPDLKVISEASKNGE